MRKIASKSIFAMLTIADAAVPLLVWPIGHDYYYYPKIICIYVLLSAIISIFGIQLFRQEIKPEFPPEFLPAAVFVLLSLLSAAFSEYVSQAFWGKDLRREGAFAYVGYFLLMYFTYEYASSPRRRDMLINCILVSAVVISALAILQYFGLDPVPKDRIRAGWKNNSFSTLGNQNFLGSYLCIVFPISLCLYLNCEEQKERPPLFVTAVTLCAALICSRTRSAWIGTSASTILTLSLLCRRRGIARRAIPLLAACVTVAVILNGSGGRLISKKFNSVVSDYKAVTETEDGTDDGVLRVGSERLFIWSRTVPLLRDRPLLGSGPDTFNMVFRMTRDEAKHYFGASYFYVDKAHNNYLQIAATMGLPALFSYVLFLFLSMKKSWSGIVRRGFQRNIYPLALFSGLLGYMIQDFFNISVVSVAPVFWSLMGLLAAHNHDHP